MSSSDCVPEPPALAAPLGGINLIEASAGTGKTWTLSGLYLRLIVEAGLTVERILAVTYTRAATAELGTRIRRRLTAMRAALDGQRCDDPLCEALAQRAADPALARLRVEAALANLDAAEIHTIHAFCHRVLALHAFAGGRPFETELAPDDDIGECQIVSDFWRREVSAVETAANAADAQVHRMLVASLLAKKQNPSRLLGEVKRLTSRHGLILDVADPAACRADLATYLASRARLAGAWAEHGADYAALLAAHPDLPRRTYSSKNLPGWWRALDRHLADDSLLPGVPESLGRLGLSALRAVCGVGKEPCHPLAAMIDEYAAAIARRDPALADLRAELLARLSRYFLAERGRRNRMRRVSGFDDLTNDLAEALAAPGGEALAASLRDRYPAALIDEFQDTDRQQYDIFARIYGGHDDRIVFLVGDPKQAIYSFRGADVFAYLHAARSTQRRFHLAENRRSVPRLVAAVNALFAGGDSFRLDGIGYAAVASAGQHLPLTESGRDDPTPLRLHLIDAENAAGLPREAARSAAVGVAARQVVRLLSDPNLLFDNRRIEARDIAVLVSTHRQATLIRAALGELGVACALSSNESVFASPEAEWLEWLLLAIDAPRRSGRIAAVLATDLFGFGAAELAALHTDSDLRDRWQAHFVALQAQWRGHGPVATLRGLLRAAGTAGRIAARVNGERTLTNLLHLCELAETAAAECDGIDGMLRWIATERRSGGGSGRELRLESDENLVRVLTVHAAKGLEFPITLCPFLWDFPEHRNGELLYHDGARGDALIADLRSSPSAVAMARAAEETSAERLRLAYVALTRASHRCEVVWARARGAQNSPLAWLLFRTHGGQLPSLDETSSRVATLAGQCAGAIGLASAPQGTLAAAVRARSTTLRVRALVAPVPLGWRMSSFSSLVRSQEAETSSELPDHDLYIDREAPPTEPGGDRLSFPRGADAGTCLHAILEHIDFSASPESWQPHIARELRSASYPGGWRDALTVWLGEVIRARWAGTLSLADLAVPRTLREVEFQMSARGTANTLAEIISAGGFSAPRLASCRLDGFLKGFIDLVFEHDGVYHLADYKSNWLGAAPESYGQDALTEAMRREAYFMQGCIYALALHRYLRGRLSSYRYAQHFGGAHYLFLRGMGATAGAGVLSFKPAADLIERLDEALA